MTSALRPVRPPGWWPDAALLAGFVALTAALAGGAFLGVDEAVREWCDAHQPPVAYWIARGFNYLGSGGYLTEIGMVLGLVVAWRMRSWRPLAPPVAAFLLTTLTILPLKNWTDRAAPRSPLPDAAALFHHVPAGEYAESYPSGHLVVAIVWYGVLLLLVDALLGTVGRGPVPPRVHRAIRVVPVVVVFLTTTYLGFHWLTDGFAGLLAGLLLDRQLSRVPWLPAD